MRIEGMGTQLCTDALSFCDPHVSIRYISKRHCEHIFSFKGNTTVHMASVVKLIILLAVIHESQERRIDINQTVSRDKIHEIPTSCIASFSENIHPFFSVKELLLLMIKNNDSVIADYFIQTLGISTINQFIHKIGVHNTCVNTSIVGLNSKLLGIECEVHTWCEFLEKMQTMQQLQLDQDMLRSLQSWNYSSADDLATLLSSALDVHLLSKDNQRIVRSILTKQSSTEFAPYYCTPIERASLGHAIGITYVNQKFYQINDVGFFQRNKDDYIIFSLCVSSVKNVSRTKHFLAYLMRETLDFFNW